MPRSNLQISVALITRNGPERLRRCLESLRAQSVQPFEVVVSDDSTPEFAAETQAVAERFGCRYLEGPRRGLYANRNRAALACRGTHIRTMDDDHLFPEGHFALCLAAMESAPGDIWTTGEIGFIDEVYFAQGKTANQLHPSGVGIAPENPDDNWAIADGSTLYPVSVFASGFRMVEDFGYGSSYLEFGAFLYHHGYRSRCIIGAQVEHHGGPETIARMYTYDRLQTESRLFSNFAYNLFFRPNLWLAAKYTLASLWHSRFDLALIARLPKIARAVRQRWKAAPPKDLS